MFFFVNEEEGTSNMLKSIALAAAVVAASLPTSASAYVHHYGHAAHHYHMLHHGVAGHHVHVDGYCNGRVDGTGPQHHCGSVTGGPVGGLSNRN